jgi:methyl-accepting chemotaxis protein
MDGWVSATLLETTKTVKKGIFKSSTTYNTTGTDISGQLASYLDEAVTAAFNSLTTSGEALGISTAGLASQSINLGTFDTTGMSASEVAAELEARFAAQMDAIADSYFGVVSEFQQGGEGLAETLYRVTVNFEQVGHSLGLIDKAVNWRTANIIADYAGGIDALNSSLSSYTQNFFSEQEQYNMMLDTMQANFASLGVTMPTTNEQFRTLIEGLDTNSDAGAKLFAEIISLADGFNEMTSASDDLTKAAQDASDEAAKAAQEAIDAEKALANERTQMMQDMIKSVSDAWLGNLSYLTLQQKTAYASGYLAFASNSGGMIDTVEAARVAAETAMRTSSTKEQYIPVFERYIQELENKAPDATLDDVVTELQTLREQFSDLEATIRKTA